MAATDGARSRRGVLAGVGAALSGWLAGCTGAARSGGEAGDRAPRAGEAAPPAADRPACAEGVRISEASARLGGDRPAVTLCVHNAGDVTVAYEVVVIFQQGTSLGIDARVGRDTLAGRVDPGETVEVTATDDAREVANAADYELDVALSCPAD